MFLCKDLNLTLDEEEKQKKHKIITLLGILLHECIFLGVFVVVSLILILHGGASSDDIFYHRTTPHVPPKRSVRPKIIDASIRRDNSVCREKKDLPKHP